MTKVKKVSKAKTRARVNLLQRRTEAETANKLYKEFQRQGRETAKYLDKKGIHEWLYEDAQKQRELHYGVAEKALEDMDTPEDELDDETDDWDEETGASAKMERTLQERNLVAGNVGGTIALMGLGVMGGGTTVDPKTGVVTPTASNYSFNLKDDTLKRVLQHRGTKITGNVSKHTLKQLRGKLIQDYYYGGQSIRDVKASIKGLFEETYKNRAENIARTEVATAQHIVQDESYRRNGCNRKRWSATNDGAVRDSHLRCAEEGFIPYDQPFSNGLMFPNDPSGPPEEVCQCRCDMEADDENGSTYCKGEANEGACQIPWTGDESEGSPDIKEPTKNETDSSKIFALPPERGGTGYIMELQKANPQELDEIIKLFDAGRYSEGLRMVGKYSSRGTATIKSMPKADYTKAKATLRQCKEI